VEQANHHDSKFFRPLFMRAKQWLNLGLGAKYLADSAMDAAWIKDELKENRMTPVIASNRRGKFKSSVPKDKNYGKRWAVERFFSRLKETFGLRNNRFIGMKTVKIYVFSCILGYLLSY
jgi:transposase